MVALYTATENNIKAACEHAAAPMRSARSLDLSKFNAMLAVSSDRRRQTSVYLTGSLAVSSEERPP